jgi:hypothetical protein
MPNFTMCLGPNCGSGQIHGGGNDQPIMTCTTCHFKTCFAHKMPWHEGLTCMQYDNRQVERLRQETASAELLGKTTKTCPNPRCGMNLDKYTGCDHVRCKYLFIYKLIHCPSYSYFNRYAVQSRILLGMPRAICQNQE